MRGSEVCRASDAWWSPHRIAWDQCADTTAFDQNFALVVGVDPAPVSNGALQK
jgi:hypothetical protein